MPIWDLEPGWTIQLKKDNKIVKIVKLIENTLCPFPLYQIIDEEGKTGVVEYFDWNLTKETSKKYVEKFQKKLEELGERRNKKC